MCLSWNIVSTCIMIWLKYWCSGWVLVPLRELKSSTSSVCVSNQIVKWLLWLIDCYGLPYIYDGWSMLYLFWVPSRSYAWVTIYKWELQVQRSDNIVLYYSFVLELFNLSGILTIFFSRIFMSHYTWHFMTDGSKVKTKWVKPWWIPKKLHLFFNLLHKKLSVSLAYCSLLISGVPLQHFRSIVKYESSFMLVWMHWTWKSRSMLATANARIIWWLIVKFKILYNLFFYLHGSLKLED